MACAADDGGWPDDEDQCSQEDAELGFWHDSLPEPRGAAAQPSEPPARASSAKKFDTVFTNAKAGMAGVDAVRVGVSLKHQTFHLTPNTLQHRSA